MTIRRRLIPYWLLAPGALWLLLFFVIPMGFMAEQALESGSLFTGGFTFSWEWSNFPDSLSGNSEQIVRSFYYAGAATLLAPCSGDPNPPGSADDQQKITEEFQNLVTG